MPPSTAASSPPALTSSARARAIIALVLIVPMATVGEAAALWLWPGSLPGSSLYVLAKVWLVLVPLVWVLWVDRVPLSWSPARAGGFGPAFALGLLTAATIVGAYAIVRRAGWINLPAMRLAIAKNHLDNLALYIAFALALSTANAVMEEYVWRWFVFRHCAALVPVVWAVPLAALFFTGHHISALKLYFNWPVTVLGSTGVWIGGMLWSWLYRRYRSIWPGVVAHMWADLAIFAVGGHMIFGQ